MILPKNKKTLSFFIEDIFRVAYLSKSMFIFKIYSQLQSSQSVSIIRYILVRGKLSNVFEAVRYWWIAGARKTRTAESLTSDIRICHSHDYFHFETTAQLAALFRVLMILGRAVKRANKIFKKIFSISEAVNWLKFNMIMILVVIKYLPSCSLVLIADIILWLWMSVKASRAPKL